MDGLIRTIAGGISGFVGHAIAAVGQVLQGLVDQLTTLLPGGGAAVVLGGAAILLLLSWNILRR